MNDGERVPVPSRFLRTCDIPLAPEKTEAFTMVIFGGGGDLAMKKLLPALFHLHNEKQLPGEFSILGFSRVDLDDKRYRQAAGQAVREYGPEQFDERRWNEFSRHLFFLSGNFEDDESYISLSRKLSAICRPAGNTEGNIIYYMAVPPQATPVAVGKLKQHHFCKGKYGTKIIVEKPFGRDLTSARELNKVLTDAFDENQIYRIDHYLGKEAVQDILFFRFSNAIFERVWNGTYIDNVQITVAEDIGIAHRGGFYEQTGVVRDIVQNHAMQIIALIAMEPPIGFSSDFIRDEKVKLIRAIRPLSGDEIDRCTVRGQYGPGTVHGSPVQGYQEEKGVAPDSSVPTLFAGRFHIANWRWAGVPFYVRTGKRLARRITEVSIQFKQPPLKLFGRTCDILEPNVLTLTIQPEEKMSLRFGVKYPQAPNKIYQATMVFNYLDTFGANRHSAYEQLLVDCVKGDLSLFVRQDSIEAAWEVVDPIIARWGQVDPAQFPNYAAGSWGPREADLLLENEGRCWLTR